MKVKYLVSTLLLITMTVGCQSKKEPKTLGEEKSIKEKSLTQAEVTDKIDQWVNLWATYDLNMIDDIFLNSETLTYFSSEKEGLITGYEQLHPHHVGFGFVDGGKQPKITLWLEDIETRIQGGTAMVAAIWYNTDYGAAKETAQNGPVTFVLVKDDQGEIKISHAHFANYK